MNMHKKPEAAFVIEKGIPILPAGRRGALLKYPFDKLEVGDSFLLSGDTKTVTRRLCGSAIIYGKRHGMKFTVRVVEGGARCWRVA